MERYYGLDRVLEPKGLGPATAWKLDNRYDLQKKKPESIWNAFTWNGTISNRFVTAAALMKVKSRQRFLILSRKEENFTIRLREVEAF